jgi:hypothetical protein
MHLQIYDLFVKIMSKMIRCAFLTAILLLGWSSRETIAASQLPENLARKAQATANSEFSDRYLARYAIDGKIPAAGVQEDLDQAWCVQGATHRQGAEIRLEWPEEITVAEVVYWGRTAWLAEECWKDYEMWVDQASSPTVKGQLERGHGPQRIRLSTPLRVRKLSLKFLSSYGGFNPGASEIQVYANYLPDGAMAPFRMLPPGRPEQIDESFVESPELVNQLVSGQLGFDKLLLIQRRELNPTHVYTYHVEGFGAGGGLYLYDLAADASRLRCSPPRPSSPANAAALRQLVASPEGQILDCDLSYDAQEILFSWRRQQHQGYQVYVINVDGSNLRQLTEGPHHNYNACWLPDGGIAFLSTRSSRFAYCWVSPVGILHRMERDGTRVTQLSANIVNDFTPSVMTDGRVIYSRWEYVDKPAIPIQSLWTIRPDGTGLVGFFGNRVLSPATFMEARSIPGASMVLCTLTSHNGPCRGAIGIIDIARGNNSQASIRNLTPEVNIGQVDKGDGNSIRGPYENPYPLDRIHFLVSSRGTVQVRTYDGSQAAKIIEPRDGLGFYSPQPLRTRPKPPVLSGTYADGSVPLTGSGTVVVSAKQESAFQSAAAPNSSKVSGENNVTWATVVLQDVYRGLEPQVKRGEVTEICVVEELRKAVRTDVANRAFGFQFPVISCGATYAAKKVWGYATVAADGSACFQVPAGRPIYFMALDVHGRAVQRMRTFTHLMPGEVQGCVGCHESRQQSPTPALSSRLATLSVPARLRAPEWGEAIGFDYSQLVQPVLDQHCVRCHQGPNPPARVDLCGDKTDFFNVSYEVLARGRKRSGEAEWDSPYVNWIPTFNGMEQNILEVTPKAWGSPRSRLAELLLDGHPDSTGQARLKMASSEIRRLLTWIDLNVPYYGTSETAYPERKGCRQLYPADLDLTLADVAKRRCAQCHAEGKIPRAIWTRITHPERNAFLSAPLAQTAGGIGACGHPVFTSPADPDYQAILKTFAPIEATLQARPRMDMPGATAAAVDRSCLGNLD